MVVQGSNDLALEGAGLTSVSANVADGGVVQDALVGFVQGLAVLVVSQRLTVDQNQRNASGNHLVDDDFGRGGLNQVADDDIHLLSDEGIDLVGLLAHVVLAIDHGDFVLNGVGLQSLEVVLDFLTVQGHEVVVVLIDGNADLVGLDIASGSGSSLSGSGSGLGSGLGSGGSSGSSGRGAAAAGCQRQGHSQDQQRRDDLLHLCSS